MSKPTLQHEWPEPREIGGLPVFFTVADRGIPVGEFLIVGSTWAGRYRKEANGSILQVIAVRPVYSIADVRRIAEAK